MSSPAAPSSRRSSRQFSRRSLLAATLAGTALVAVGCTGRGDDGADAVTPAQADKLDRQVGVQAALVAAYDQAFTAAPDLAAAAATLGDQAREQLSRLRKAAPGSTSSAGSSGAAGSTSPAPEAAGARAWLQAQVTAAAQAHAAACPEFTGARAALLGSIAAGLRGQAGQLA